MDTQTETVRNCALRNIQGTLRLNLFTSLFSTGLGCHILFMLSCIEVAFERGKIIHFHTCEILVLLCHLSNLSPGWTATGFVVNIHGAQRINPVEPGDSQTFPRVPQLNQQSWFSRMLSPKLCLTFNGSGNGIYVVLYMYIFTIKHRYEQEDLNWFFSLP